LLSLPLLFAFSPPFYISVTYFSPLCQQSQKSANFSESEVNQYEGVQIMVQSRSLA
jgi:hypothetical protein